MKKISESQYKKACERIEEILKVVNEKIPADDPKMKELLEVSRVVEKYEKIHYKL